MTPALLALVLAMPCQPSISFAGGGRSHRIQVEIARDAKAREKGLMFVERLAPNRGMWFIFPDPRPRQFWMKNTSIPLDIIFVDTRLRVINVIHSAAPNTLEGRRSTAPAKYVLELAGGQARSRGLKQGIKLAICGFEQP